MTPKNLNTIVEFLEGIKEQSEDQCNGEKSWFLVTISYPDLCEALEATGRYDDSGYKYAVVTQDDRNEKYSLDQRNSKEEFLHEYKS